MSIPTNDFDDPRSRTTHIPLYWKPPDHQKVARLLSIDLGPFVDESNDDGTLADEMAVDACPWNEAVSLDPGADPPTQLVPELQFPAAPAQ
jgi:hypothetical protein